MPRRSGGDKPKRGFLDGYKTYNPEIEGYGDSSSWRNAFNYRMGVDEARKAVGNDSPRSILQVGLQATWAEIQKAYRKLVKLCHPDLVPGQEEMFRRVQGAYELLEVEFGKG